MATRITDAVLATMVPGQVIRDSNVRGFAARMAPDGRVSFIVRREGAHRIFKTIGHSDVMSIAVARKAAQTILAKHLLGSPEPKRITLAEAWAKQREHIVRMAKAKRTVDGYDEGFARLDPKVKATTLRELAEAPELMLAEWERIQQRGPAAADASARFVKMVYRYALERLDRSLPASHPCVDIPLGVKEPAKPLQVMARKDLGRWWLAVSKLQNPIRQQCHRFSLLSGLRRNSLYEMQWKDFHEEERCFHIPTPKGGAGRAFDLVLSAAMRDCLITVAILHRAGNPWVWPGESSTGHLTNLQEDKKRGVFVYLHGCRRTYASLAREAGVEEDLISRLLNQGGKRNVVTSHYIRTSAIGPLLFAAQEKISDYIVAGLLGSSARPEEEQHGYRPSIRDLLD